MTKPIQEPIEQRQPVENKYEVIQAEINHIADSNPYIKTQREIDLHKWFDWQKKTKSCGLVIEDRGSSLSKSCWDYCPKMPQPEKKLVSVPLDNFYVRASQSGRATTLLIDILNAFCTPLNSGSLRELRKRVIGNLKVYQVKLLIVDDAHLLKREAMIELIRIYDDLRIPVVMTGVEDLQTKLDSSKEYKHIYNAFLKTHYYRKLTKDEVASVVAAWEDEILELWEEKLNLADNEVIINTLYDRSGGLVLPLYDCLRNIAIAQLENTLNPSSEEGITIDQAIGFAQPPKVSM